MKSTSVVLVALEPLLRGLSSGTLFQANGAAGTAFPLQRFCGPALRYASGQGTGKDPSGSARTSVTGDLGRKAQVLLLLLFFKDNLEFWVSQPSKAPMCTLQDQITRRSDPLPEVCGFPGSGITNTFAGGEGKRQCAGEEACAAMNLVGRALSGRAGTRATRRPLCCARTTEPEDRGQKERPTLQYMP